jgi:hypothetical protein
VIEDHHIDGYFQHKSILQANIFSRWLKKNSFQQLFMKLNKLQTKVANKSVGDFANLSVFDKKPVYNNTKKKSNISLASLSPFLNTDVVRKVGLASFGAVTYIARSKFLKTKKFQYLVLPILILLTLFGYGFYTYAYSMGSYFTATITYKYININETRIISSSEASALKPVLLTAEESVTSVGNATGEKATGEKSKGAVSIFNPTTEIKVIPGGTVLTCISNTCNSLTFVTDNTLNLGPGSSEQVNVTAGDIGENYNLQPGAGRFKVGNFDYSKEVLATNVKSISGGTPKKMVKIVTKDDIKKAQDSALNNLKTTLLNKVKEDPENEKSLIADSTLKVELVSAEPDKKENEETEIVNVSLKAKASIQAFPSEEISTFMEKLKSEITPEGYYLDDKFTKTNSKLEKQRDKVNVVVVITSIARPKIDVDQVKKNLAGKSFKESDKIVSSIPNINGYTNNYEPQTLPKLFWKIPKNTNRIQIKLVAEE